jgi:hypothetical protein
MRPTFVELGSPRNSNPARRIKDGQPVYEPVFLRPGSHLKTGRGRSLLSDDGSKGRPETKSGRRAPRVTQPAATLG